MTHPNYLGYAMALHGQTVRAAPARIESRLIRPGLPSLARSYRGNYHVVSKSRFATVHNMPLWAYQIALTCHIKLATRWVRNVVKQTRIDTAILALLSAVLGCTLLAGRIEQLRSATPVVAPSVSAVTLDQVVVTSKFPGLPAPLALPAPMADQSEIPVPLPISLPSEIPVQLIPISKRAGPLVTKNATDLAKPVVPEEDFVLTVPRKNKPTTETTAPPQQRAVAAKSPPWYATTFNDGALVIRSHGTFRQIRPGQILPDGETLKSVNEPASSYTTSAGTFIISQGVPNE